jgi:hypothetical protein
MGCCCQGIWLVGGEAITYLRAKGLIVYKPESTEVIALTPDGLGSADRFIRQRQCPRVNDPIPITLDDIRCGEAQIL